MSVEEAIQESRGDESAGAHARAAATGTLVPLEREASMLYEGLASRLLIAGERGTFVVAVSSAVSGEGVSTVCLGLAMALAMSTTKRVVLVDANLRRPVLHERLGLPLQPGLHEVVAGNDLIEWAPDSDEIFAALALDAQRTSLPNLWLVSSGEPLAHPSAITTSGGAKTAILGLRNRYDYVIIDCPPLLTTVDAATLCRVADAALLVVRAGITPREDVRRAQDSLQGAPILGVVLNGV